MSMEFRWDGAAAEKNLGDSPTKAQINGLFAIPRDTKSDSALPHHSVSADGTVGAADETGCTAAIAALNGSRGGVSASTAEKNKAYSHLASHLRSMGVDPPDKQFAAVLDLELRAQRRTGMLRVPERIGLRFGAAGVQMRAKASGTGGTSFHFTGYATVYDHPFEMWDFWGDPFSEKVAAGAGARTLANNCDVPFLVGHNDAGIPMARTKSGTMKLGEDSHGLWVDAPGLDGSVEQIRQLASAVERGDMDEMSMAFMTCRQDWSPDYMERTILEYDLHKGDVSVVVFGANDGTAGSSMPPELLTARRPTGIWQQGAGQARILPGYSGAPDYDPQPVPGLAAAHAFTGTHTHAHTSYGFGDGDSDADDHEHEHSHDGDASHDHGHAYDADGLIVVDAGGVPQELEGDAAQALARRTRELELLKLTA